MASEELLEPVTSRIQRSTRPQRGPRESTSVLLLFGAIILALGAGLTIAVGIFIHLEPAAFFQPGGPFYDHGHSKTMYGISDWIVVTGAGILYVGGAGYIAWLSRSEVENHRTEFACLRAASLPDRARHAAQVMQEATMLVGELQTELTARTALLENVQRQAAEATEHAADMQKLASVDDDTMRAVNKYLDGLLDHRLTDLEHTARGREWLIAALGIPVGILVIALAHFMLGF